MLSRSLLVIASIYTVSAFAQIQGKYPAIPLQQVTCVGNQRGDLWLTGVLQEAKSDGITQATINATMGHLAYVPEVYRRDHNQKVFQQSFLQFASNAVSAQRLRDGNKILQANSTLFKDIENRFGVPGSVLVSFWALESDFGASQGDFDVIQAVTTLACDPRRSDFFRTQLIGILQIVQRGDMKPEDMTGDWAGELSGLQFTPADYFKYAINYSHTPHLDLVNDIPNMLASAANFLQGLGFQRGQPWLQEVHVPLQMHWEEADLAILNHTRAEWAAMGVTARDGDLPKDNLTAALWLPMGRLGPAFLAYPNFTNGYIGWNKALVYSTTAAYMATRFDGAPAFGKGNGVVTPLTPDQLTQLQQLLVAQGFSTDKPDGQLGASTRTAVKKAQLKLHMPADSYPNQELIDRLSALNPRGT